MRVLLVDPSEKGALPLYTGMVAQALTAGGAEVVVLANTNMHDPQLEGSWQVLRRLLAGAWPPPAGAKPKSAISQALQWFGLAATVWRTARELRPDVVHIQHPLHPRLDPWLLFWLKKLTRVAWTAHDVLPHDGGRNQVARSRAIYQTADLVMVHNEPARLQVREVAGIDAFVIRHPVRPIAAPPGRHDARRRLGFGDNERVLSAVGFIRRYKGYALLAEALRLTSDPALRLVVLGQLVDESEQAILEELSRDPRVDMKLGYAQEGELIELIAASDAVLLPHATGSDSGSLHMARALNVPVIASDAPQIAAVVRATGAGMVVRRDPILWAQAMFGLLPSPPPPPPSPAEIGAEHIRLYGKPYVR